MKKKINGKLIFNIVVFVLSISLIIYFCLSPNGLADLLKSAKEFRPGWFVGGILCQILNILLDCYLILIFIRNSKPDFSLKDSFQAGMVGQFFSAVTPSATGGQPMQVYFLSKKEVGAGISTSALTQKFFVYQTCITLYSIFAISVCLDFFKTILTPLVWQLSIIGFLSQAFIIFLILLFSFNQKVTSRLICFFINLLAKIRIIKNPTQTIQKAEAQLVFFYNGNKDLYKNKLFVVKTYIITIVQLTAVFSIPYCIYRGFGLNKESMLTMVCTQAFVNMTASLVPLPGASGASEGSFYLFFGAFFTDATLKSAIILWRTFSYYLTILISAPFSMLTKKNTKRETPLIDE